MNSSVRSMFIYSPADSPMCSIDNLEMFHPMNFLLICTHTGS